MQDFIIAAAAPAQPGKTLKDIIWLQPAFQIAGTIYTDDGSEELQAKAAEAIRQGLPVSLVPLNREEWYQRFKDLCEKGHNILFLIPEKTDAISYQEALFAWKKASAEYPDLRFCFTGVPDYLPGLNYLLRELVRYKENTGADLEQCLRFVCALRYKIAHRGLPEDILHVRRSGVLNAGSVPLSLGKNEKALLYLSEEGQLRYSGKAKDRADGIRQLIRSVKKDIGDPQRKALDVYYCLDKEEAMKAASRLRDEYPSLGAITVRPVSAVSLIQAGAGTIAFIYQCEQRRP